MRHINMKWNGIPTIIFGKGAMSKEIYYTIKDINNHNNQNIYEVLGFVSEESQDIGYKITSDNIEIITSDEYVTEYIKKYKLIAVVIPLSSHKAKANIYEKLKNKDNIIFPNIIHPSVRLSNNISLGIGNAIMKNAILTYDISVGDFNLINIQSTIGHGTNIKSFCTINPNALISGDVCIQDNVFIGVGATVLQNITIEKNAVVGAGATVIKDVKENTTVVGIPAEELKRGSDE